MTAMTWQATDEAQAEGDPLFHLLSLNCLKISDHVTEVKNIFDNNGIDYDTLLQLTEDELIETFKDIGIKVWHRRLIINKLKTIPQSGANTPAPVSSSFVVLTEEQNNFLVNIQTNLQYAKKNSIKLEELEAEIHENAKKLTCEIDKHYTQLMNILTKQKEIALQKVEAAKTRKLNIVKKQHVEANNAMRFLADSDAKFKQIIHDKKLEPTKKQIAITQHIGSSQQQLVKHKQYLQDNMVFATQSQLKYEAKDKKIFTQFVNTMDDILDGDINFTQIKFNNDTAIIAWKSDLANVVQDVEIELEFREVGKNKDDEKQPAQWKKLESLKPNQTKIFLLGGTHGDHEEKRDDDMKYDMKEDDIDKGKAGVLTGKTQYQFRISVTISANILYSNILIVQTPRFNRIESSIITASEQAQLMQWIPDSNVCQFKLLFRGSRDGFGCSTFHQKCDGKGPNFSIIRSNHNHVFGGYAETGWDASINSYKYDDNAWLYLLRSLKGDKPKVFKIKNKQNAIYTHSSYGPVYGNGHDLRICNNANTTNSNTVKFGVGYDAATDSNQIAGATSYQVIDYEVWQLIIPRFSKMESSVLKAQEFAKLDEWLKQSGKRQYRLLLRGTTDGFAADIFHKKCDNQGATLAIIQSSTNHVFGGYTEKSWVHSADYLQDDNAWIYLLRSSKGDQPQKWTPTKSKTMAIYKNNDRCCAFGGGHDIYIASGCNSNTSSYSNLGHSYSADSDKTKLAGSYNFKVAEYEIWNVF